MTAQNATVAWNRPHEGGSRVPGYDRKGSEMETFGSCWIEQLLRWKCIEATRELKEDLKRSREALVISGGVLDTEGLDDGTAVVHK